MTRSARRGPWLPAEDLALIELVRITGPHNWVRIAQQLHNRSPKQCRERYHQNLKANLNHDPISPQEGEFIEQLVEEVGKRWAEIARRLGNRSDNAVKNWYNGSMNRRRRRLPQHHNGKPLDHRIFNNPCTPAQQRSKAVKSRSVLEPSMVSDYHDHEPRPRSIQSAVNENIEMVQPRKTYGWNRVSHIQTFELQPRESQGSVHLPSLSQTFAYHDTWTNDIVSPAMSEVSHVSLQQTPSLMSDVGSVSTASPGSVVYPHTFDTSPGSLAPHSQFMPVSKDLQRYKLSTASQVVPCWTSNVPANTPSHYQPQYYEHHHSSRSQTTVQHETQRSQDGRMQLSNLLH